MKSLLPVRALYAAASIYDGALGLAFIFAAPALFERAGVTPPNHFGYVHFAAALLVVFALMFAQIARDPSRNRGLIFYGVLLKASYVATVLWHEFHGGVPGIWKIFAACDAAFLLLFLASLPAIGRARN